MATVNKSTPQGVYKNPRFMHVSTSIVGCTVHLQTKDGSIWEGLFATFSSEFAICLDLAVQIDPKFAANRRDCLYQSLRNGAKAQEKAFFDLKDIVRITAVDVDLNAIKEMDKLATDVDISGFSSGKTPGEHRELESWQDDEIDETNEDSLMSLDDVVATNKSGSQNNSRGWDADEMFEFNKRVHKVNSTYDGDLRDYTIALPKHGKQDKDWRRKQERAAAIAREIETNPQSQGRLAKEDGSDDEEEKFSAVVRPGLDQKPSSQQQQPQQQSRQQTHQTPHSQPQLQQQQQQQTPTPPQNQSQSQPQQQSQQQTPQLSSQQQPKNQHQNHNQPQHTTQQQPQQQQQQPQSHQPQQQHMHQHQNLPQRQIPNRINNGAHKNLRPRFANQRFESNINSLKNFNRQFHMTPSPRHQQSQTPSQMQGPSPNGQNQQQSPLQQSNATTAPSLTKVTPQAVADTSTTSERSDTTNSSVSTSNQSKDQSEIAKNSKLNPNAKEFVYKPRSPATSIQGSQTNGATNPAATMDPSNSSPMSQPAHGAYYQQVPIFSHGLPPHQQQHHPAQFMPNHPHMHFQSQIHYMPTPLGPHFAPQQMSPRYIRGNFQNYHHRSGGEHMNNVRTPYSQSPMVGVPTSAAGQPYVPPSGGPPPHPMNAYAAGAPQQPMMYGGPQQSVYSMVPTPGFPQHMPHVPNPPPYDGSQYMPPTQNYVVNQ